MSEAKVPSCAKSWKLNVLIGALFSLTISTHALSQTASSAYKRDPDLHGNNVVFTSQGDLWLANINMNGESELAKRLTSHPNLERSAKFSPDGSQIAFVASYNNLPAVHVIDSDGGIAKQVSFEYGRTNLHGWVDDAHVLISANSDTGMHSSWELKKVNVNTMELETLPLSDAFEGVLDEAQKQVFFVQHGLQVSTDNAAHYKGGAAGELWRFDLKSRNKNKEAVKLTGEHSGSVHTPMLHEKSGRVYFISNENDIDNIWSMQTDGSDIQQHTKFEQWAVRQASLDGDTIVFQHGADLKRFNVSNKTVQDIEVVLRSDFVDLRTQYINQPLEYFQDASPSSNGSDVLITARGKMALANSKGKRLIEISTQADARARNGIISKDGKYVYAISDASGDYEIWQYAANGSSESKQLTESGRILKTNLWSAPDGKTLFYTEKSGGLFSLNLNSKKVSKLNTAEIHTVFDIRFSNNGRYVAIVFNAESSQRSQIYLHDLQENKGTVLSTAKYASYSPSFSDDLSWLYFLSDRNFSPAPSSPWGDRNMGVAFDKRTQVFAIALQQDATYPFAPPTELDETAVKNEDESGNTDDEADEQEKEVEFAGIASRLWQIDLPSDNYNDLLVNENGLYMQAGSTLYNQAFEYDAERTEMTSGVSFIEMDIDKKHLLVGKGRGDSTKLYMVPASLTYPSKDSEHQVNSDNWTLAINPKDEWRSLFKDAWLMHRDSLFDANMRGVDWSASKQKYTSLLERVSERSELNDVFEQMMGELNALHSQVRGGDLSDDENAPSPAILGASYKDTKKGVVIDTIFDFDREILAHAPPLSHPSVNAQEGDIITSVNNKVVSNIAELKQALFNTGGQQVLLGLKRGKTTINTIVEPRSSWSINRMRHRHWTQKNLAKVNKANKDLGYFHLYAMGGQDISAFAREFYAQISKQGLIIDVRRNRGGNIDSIIIEKLMRKAWSFWASPTWGTYSNMQNAFRGHIVVLADEFTYSDGETFTAGMKSMGLATIVGKTTAGAGVWLSGQNRLADGGIARVAEFPVFDMQGNWITEGRGISPDIEIDNLPHATFKGEDAQLEYAIQLLEKKLKEMPVPEMKALPFPPVEQAAGDAKAMQ